MNEDTVAQSTNETESPTSADAIGNQGATQGITTAHIYLNRWFKRLNHGKAYKKTVSTILAEAPLPEETSEAIEAAAALLKAANESAPNASAQTRRRWLREMSARLSALGHVVPR